MPSFVSQPLCSFTKVFFCNISPSATLGDELPHRRRRRRRKFPGHSSDGDGQTRMKDLFIIIIFAFHSFTIPRLLHFAAPNQLLVDEDNNLKCVENFLLVFLFLSKEFRSSLCPFVRLAPPPSSPSVDNNIS